VGKLSEKKLLILTIGVTVLLAAGLGFLIWRDIQAIDEEQATIESLNQRIDLADLEIEKIPQREYQVIANREISEKETSILPEETEIEQFWEGLERSAVTSGVKISEIAADRTATQRNAKKKDKTSIERVSQSLTLRATVDEFLTFLNLLDNNDRIINVDEWTLTSGSEPDADGKIRHTIKLVMTTFTYSQKIANTIVSIPQYEKKMEHPEVKKAMSAIKVSEKENYTLRSAVDRRDPFVNVRRPVEDKPLAPAADRKTQEEILARLKEEVRSLVEGLDLEDTLLRDKRLFLHKQQVEDNRRDYARLLQLLDQTQREKLIVDRDLLEEFRDDVMTPFLAIQERLSQMEEQQPKLTRESVQAYHDRIAEYFDERDWKKVQEEVRSFLTMSKDGEHVEDDARDLVDAIKEFLRRAEVIQEFDKKQWTISGIVYQANGTSLAIINGKTVLEQDAVDPEGKIIVVEIGENYVIFETEGVEIKKTKQ